MSIGNEGANKDLRETGYTSPCSPAGGLHEYTITLYALATPPHRLPDQDAISVDWTVMSAAIKDRIIASAQLSFEN
jgi:phosphatidylethanolamine-binding protein (PEBP) family uncharacterized protein